MTKQEEIEDSLEFCHDLYHYYKRTDPAEANSFGVAIRDSHFVPSEMLNGNYEYGEVQNQPSFLGALAGNLLSILLCLVIAFAAAKLLNIFVIQQTVVEGSSMETTLQNGDRLFVNKFAYRFHDPDRFDIVIFPFEKDVYYIKRVIGLPGETVKIQDGLIYINGEKLTEEYGSQLIEYAGSAEEGITLGKDEYFVMGDNRNDSLDSRFETVGTINRSRIAGKAFLRIYPFVHFGLLQ